MKMLSAFVSRFRKRGRRSKHPSRAYNHSPAQLYSEQLEARIVPYTTNGGAWPHPELVTISFAPDGTYVNGNTSDLFARMNAKFGSSTVWQNQILKAAQAWAQQTNLNFTVVSDNGADKGSGLYQQGDPGFGDIRFFGYNFGTSTLAMAYAPPPVSNYSIAGDININTAQTWNIGTTYDLFTVSMHELGHALGLGHSTSATSVMYATYNGVDSGLGTDDINGIRSIYGGARSNDSYDAAASNETFSTATNITSLIDSGTKTAVVTGLDITTTSDIDFYKFTAPSGGSGSLSVVVQSSGLSLLAPKFWIYNSSQSQLAVVTGSGNFGSTLQKTVSGIVAGQTYYVKVDGAVSTSFGTGSYAISLNFGTGGDPVIPLPNTQTLNGDPLITGGGEPIVPFGQPHPHDDHNLVSDGEVSVHGEVAATSSRGLEFLTRANRRSPDEIVSARLDWPKLQEILLAALDA
jgi:predicted Zn-dependent protease